MAAPRRSSRASRAPTRYADFVSADPDAPPSPPPPRRRLYVPGVAKPDGGGDAPVVKRQCLAPDGAPAADRDDAPAPAVTQLLSMVQADAVATALPRPPPALLVVTGAESLAQAPAVEVPPPQFDHVEFRCTIVVPPVERRLLALQMIGGEMACALCDNKTRQLVFYDDYSFYSLCLACAPRAAVVSSRFTAPQLAQMCKCAAAVGPSATAQTFVALSWHKDSECAPR